MKAAIGDATPVAWTQKGSSGVSPSLVTPVTLLSFFTTKAQTSDSRTFFSNTAPTPIVGVSTIGSVTRALSMPFR